MPSMSMRWPFAAILMRGVFVSGIGFRQTMICILRGPLYLLVGRDPRYVLAEDERVDLVRSFVGIDRLDVAHVTADLVLVADPVRSEQLAAERRALARRAHVVPLAEAHVVGLELLLVLHA